MEAPTNNNAHYKDASTCSKATIDNVLGRKPLSLVVYEALSSTRGYTGYQLHRTIQKLHRTTQHEFQHPMKQHIIHGAVGMATTWERKPLFPQPGIWAPVRLSNQYNNEVVRS